MSDKTKNIVVTIVFLSLIILIFVFNILKQDTKISLTERRKLAKFPEITAKRIINGTFSEEFEKYTTDQIIKREEFRKLKAMTEFKVFLKKDNNNIYEKNGSIIKLEYPLNEQSVLNVSKKINEINNNYLGNAKIYYSIIPDKNYFSDEKEYIKMDYERLQNLMKENIKNAEYINIFDELKLEDYYLTDIHWKQENLQKVANKIAEKMNFKERLKTPYTKKDLTDFEGTYAGQLPLGNKKDRISILTNEIIEDAITYNYENNKQSSIYDLEKLNSYDKYDIYLSGPTPLLTITNLKAEIDKELIVFRDSFGSSIIPLFTEGYSKITLVDIRYMRSKDLEKYIEFKNQDILFLYSTTVLNNSMTLK